MKSHILSPSNRLPHTSYRFLLSAFCLLFSFITLPAQQPFIDIDENTQNRIMVASVQNCDLYSNFYVDQSSIIKNNNQIPSYALYQNLWDTIFIRNEAIVIPFFDQQLKIILVQESNIPFAFPTSGAVSIGFIKNKRRQHTGIDFSVSKKEPVVACFDGVVRVAKKYVEYENTVVIRHYNGLETVYALMENVCVVTNQSVNAGELIGYINIADPTKKNALHFETRFLNEFFNPEKMISFSDRKLHSNIMLLTPNDFITIPVITPTQPKKKIETTSDNQSSEELLLDTPKSMPIFHTVEKGETIFKICAKYNITEKQLRLLNNIKGDHIEIGQKLRIQ
jgi:murein DD-endopeptidase MepM/ murein hydrolase activator NlpD